MPHPGFEKVLMRNLDIFLCGLTVSYCYWEFPTLPPNDARQLALSTSQPSLVQHTPDRHLALGPGTSISLS
jgi:hypothetical protein